ncbi:MAG: LLM class F420-dependent oxidoreductase [Gammaproteobacteria bacterium]|nr:LLM class F420-dependent oxidoreductase [Gammaproteobacteria bacterium]
MKLGLVASSLAELYLPVELVKQAEALGFESVWTAEAYGSDAVSPAAWLLAQTNSIKVGTAIMQMPARTPTMAAMTALTLNQLSEGRFLLGLGPSGPGVVEGWYGVPYGRSLTRTREYISIIRQVLERKAPLMHEGFHYQIPNTGEGTTGLGKPLKSILKSNYELPIYTAAVTPKGLACAAEVADGVFPIWMNPERFDILQPHLEDGFAVSGNNLESFCVSPFVQVVVNDDVDAARLPVKQHMALYIGGMGPRDKNFYNDYVSRMGYADEAGQIQDLYLSGDKAKAAAMVPDDLVDAVALVGPKARVRERLQTWKQAGEAGHVGRMMIAGADSDVLALIAAELL